MSWAEQVKEQIPLEERGRFLNDVQILVASLRGEREPEVTDLLRQNAELALAYLDEGPKKDKARRALS